MLDLLQKPRRFFLEKGAAAMEGEHLGGKIGDAGGGFGDGNAAGVDIGDEVAVGVGVAGFWRVGHIGGEAFGGGQAGALADEQDEYAGGEEIADGVDNAHAAITDGEGLTQRPTAGAELIAKQGKQAGQLRGDGGNG